MKWNYIINWILMHEGQTVWEETFRWEGPFRAIRYLELHGVLWECFTAKR